MAALRRMRRGPKAGELVLEIPGGVVRIVTESARLMPGQVALVEVTADGDRYAGEPPAWAKTVHDKTGAVVFIWTRGA